MDAIIFEDGTQRPLGGDNSIIFEQSFITEKIEGFGNRRYSYKKTKRSIDLVLGEGRGYLDRA